MNRINVLVVDDSALVRQIISQILVSNSRFSVRTASDPLIAMKRIEVSQPDVIVLDLELPRMDGLTFLAQLNRGPYIPVVVCSTLAGRGTEAALQATSLGAVEVIEKARIGVKDFFEEAAGLLIDAVLGAAASRPRNVARISATISAPIALLGTTTDQVVAVGASTGGTEALALVLKELPADAPGFAIVQHMPAGFTGAFARRLDGECAIDVKEAVTGDRIRQGRALIAPGNRHLRVVRSGAQYVAEVSDGPLVARHRPSVDVLFESVARAAGWNATGVILTGMGADGAAGLLAMKIAGAHTIAQDEATSVVFGMPKEAIALGAAAEILPLQRIARAVVELSRRRQHSAVGTRV